MNNFRVNTNYAKALFMLAGDRGQTDRVAEDMRLVMQVTAENRELGVLFANPVIPFDKKVAIVDELFAPHVCEETMAFLDFVVRKNRSVSLQGIANAYVEMWRDARNIVLGDLVTYQSVDDTARRMVTEMVSNYTGKQVELHDRTDQKMLGGFKLEFDHKMYDARIRTKIRKLRMEFAKNEYESKL